MVVLRFRPERAGVDGELALAAIDVLGTEMAVLDPGGRVVWVSAAWRNAAGAHDDPLTGSVVGSNLVELLRSRSDDHSDRVARDIAAVAAGSRAISVAQVFADDGATRWMLLARQLPPRRGAVVTRTDPAGWSPPTQPPPPDRIDTRRMIAGLSPRELDVLRLMTQGLDNRQIAARLGVAYTTVRSHTRSLIDKLGARSRLDAVVRAYRAGVGTV